MSRAGLHLGAHADVGGSLDVRCSGGYGTGQGLTSQISAAYCAMVRSLENVPEAALAQSSGAADGRYALVAARLAPEKGVDIAIQAGFGGTFFFVAM